MRRTLLARLRADRRGATAIEFALVAPLLLALLFGGIETGRYLWFAAVLDHALGDAARCAGLRPSACEGPDALADAVAQALGRFGVGLPAAAIAARPAPCGTLVVVKQAYPALVPGLAPALPPLKASACIAASV